MLIVETGQLANPLGDGATSEEMIASAI